SYTSLYFLMVNYISLARAARIVKYDKHPSCNGQSCAVAEPIHSHTVDHRPLKTAPRQVSRQSSAIRQCSRPALVLFCQFPGKYARVQSTGAIYYRHGYFLLSET